MRAVGAYSVLEDDLCVGEGGNGGSGPLGRAGDERDEGQYRCSAEVVAVPARRVPRTRVDLRVSFIQYSRKVEGYGLYARTVPEAKKRPFVTVCTKSFAAR